MKRLEKTIYALIVLVGTDHIFVTFAMFSSLSADAIWFAASGGAMIFAGFLNFARMRVADTVVRIMCLFGNLLMLIFFVFLMKIALEPHIVFGTILFSAALIFSIRNQHD